MGFLILLKMTSYLIMTQQQNQDESYKDHARGHFIGIDKLERLKLLPNDPLSTSLIKRAWRLLTPVQGEPVWVADKTQSFNAWWR